MPAADTKQKVTAIVAAKTALKREDGLTLLFDFYDYAGLDACRKAALRFRMAFYTMRAKQRRHDDFQYDALMCLIEEQPNGWQVTLKRETNIVRVVGDPIRELTPEYQRWHSLRMAATECRGLNNLPSRPCPFSDEDVVFFWDYNPEGARAIYEDLGWPKPGEPVDELPPQRPSKWDKYLETQPEGN